MKAVRFTDEALEKVQAYADKYCSGDFMKALGQLISKGLRV